MNTRKMEIRKYLQQFGQVNNFLVVIILLTHDLRCDVTSQPVYHGEYSVCQGEKRNIVPSAGRMCLRTPRL